jgi:hypothetical protein
MQLHGVQGSGVDEPTIFQVSLSKDCLCLEYLGSSVAGSRWSHKQVDSVVLQCDNLGGSTRGGPARCSLLPLLLELLVHWGVELLVCEVGVLRFGEGSEEGSEGGSLEQVNCMLIIAGLIRRHQ